VYVVVDGSNSPGTGAGLFTLNVRESTGACGDGVLDGGETCDDGNTVAGDGCDATCNVEPINAATQTSLDVCPGALIPLVDSGTGKHAHLTASTGLAGLAANFGTSCGASGAPDVVHRLHADVNGLATVTLDAQFASAIAVRTACTTLAADQLSCSIRQVFPPGSSDYYFEGSGWAPKTVTFPVLAGKDYFLVISSQFATGSASRGIYQLDARIDPSVCGDGVLAGGEACDDGNTIAGDGCNATCGIEALSGDTCAVAVPLPLAISGSGYAGTISMSTTHLKADATLTGCASTGRDAFVRIDAPASGILTARVHDATFDATLGAWTSCGGATLVCANNSANLAPEQIMFPVTAGTSYWLVVDSPTADGYGLFSLDVSLLPSVCGDGLRAGNEECDDGNNTPGDGCSASCTAEVLAGVDYCDGYPIALTGAGTTPRVASITVDTRSLVANTSGLCDGSGPEGVLKITSDISGTLKAKLTQPTYAGVLYARTTCADPYSEIKTATSCVDISDPTTVTFYVTAATPYYLFVDGIGGDRGVTGVQLSVTP
jgi:cysteine-rich repeat protein